MPVDPAMLATGAEWAIDGVGGAGAGAAQRPAGPTGFGEVLEREVGRLSEMQTEAADASQALAAGTATDAASVVMAVERARLSMQLASQIRTKGVEAIQDILHTQI